MAVLAAAFIPLIVVPTPGLFGTLAAVTALLVTTTLLAIGTAAVFPFEMDTVVLLCGNKLVATHYGFYNTVVGVIAAYALLRLQRTDRAAAAPEQHVTGRHRLPSGRHRLTEPAFAGADTVTTPLRRRTGYRVEPVNPHRASTEPRPAPESPQHTYRRQPSPPRLRQPTGEDRLGPGRRIPTGAPPPWPGSEPDRRGHRRVPPPTPRIHPSAEDRRSRYPAAGPENRR